MASLTALLVSRYRAFAGDEVLPLRPMTLLYGRNNSGKSALSRAFAMIGASVSENATSALTIPPEVLRGGLFTDLAWQGEAGDYSFDFELRWNAGDVREARYTLDGSAGRAPYVKELILKGHSDHVIWTGRAAPGRSMHSATGGQEVWFTGLVPRDVDVPPLATLAANMAALRGRVRWLDGDPTYAPTGDNGPVDAWLVSTGAVSAVFRDVLHRGLVAAAGPRAQPLTDTHNPRRWNLPGALEIRVERRGASDWNNRLLTITDAEALILEPLHLILENNRTEPAFIRALAGPTDGTTFYDRTHEPAKIFMHGGGGGEAKIWLAALTVGPPGPANWRRMLRSWVLFDQDSGEQDARTPSAGAVALIEECEKVVATYGPGLSWVCLRRRELESYVPDAGLLAHQTTRLQAFVQQVISWRADLTQATWAS